MWGRAIFGSQASNVPLAKATDRFGLCVGQSRQTMARVSQDPVTLSAERTEWPLGEAARAASARGTPVRDHFAVGGGFPISGLMKSQCWLRNASTYQSTVSRSPLPKSTSLRHPSDSSCSVSTMYRKSLK